MTDGGSLGCMATPPRVLHVMWSLGTGGAERALYQLVLAQRASGMDVAVLVASKPGLYGERLAGQGVAVVSLGQRSGLDLLAARRARALFARWPIVHFHVAEPPLMLAAATAPGRAYYTHRAGLFRYPLARRARYGTVGSVVRRRFDGVAANTRHAADVAAQLLRVPRSQVDVVYNGIDWDLLRPERDERAVVAELGLRPGDVVVGTSANLRGWKRIDLLVHAVARLSRGALVVVGDGPDRAALESLAERTGLAARARFVGHTANVADYLQVMDIFALPSGPEESFGNSAVEAMGLGLPTVVLRDGGGLTEHVSHRETGVIADGADDLAYWIERLADDAQLRRNLGTSAREEVRSRYTTEQMVRGYARLYERFVEEAA